MSSITKYTRVIYRKDKGYYCQGADHWTNDIFKAIWYDYENETTNDDLLEGFSSDTKVLKIVAMVNINDE
jgi:hypothetical protein